jgi:hypothetical protein
MPQEKHRSLNRNIPEALTIRGTDAKECPFPWVSKCVRLSDALVGDLRGEDGHLESGEIATATPKIFPALLEALR